MLLWGLLWLVVAAIGLARRTCPPVILLSSVRSSAIAGLSIAGLLWTMDHTRMTSPAFHVGIVGIPLALMGAGFGRLKDGRRIGTAFLEGSHAMTASTSRCPPDGCGGLSRKACEEHP